MDNYPTSDGQKQKYSISDDVHAKNELFAQTQLARIRRYNIKLEFASQNEQKTIQNQINAIKKEFEGQFSEIIYYQVKRYAFANADKGLTFDDFKGAAIRGLYDAIDTYDPARKAKFNTHLTNHIGYSIQHMLRDEVYHIGGIRIPAAVYEQHQRTRAGKLGDISANAQELLNNPIRVESIDTPNAEGDTRETIDPRAVSPETLVTSKDQDKILRAAIDSIPNPKQKLVMQLYYFDPDEPNKSEIASRLHISSNYVGTLIKDAQAYLAKKLRLNEYGEVEINLSHKRSSLSSRTSGAALVEPNVSIPSETLFAEQNNSSDKNFFTDHQREKPIEKLEVHSDSTLSLDLARENSRKLVVSFIKDAGQSIREFNRQIKSIKNDWARPGIGFVSYHLPAIIKELDLTKEQAQHLRKTRLPALDHKWLEQNVPEAQRAGKLFEAYIACAGMNGAQFAREVLNLSESRVDQLIHGDPFGENEEKAATYFQNISNVLPENHQWFDNNEAQYFKAACKYQVEKPPKKPISPKEPKLFPEPQLGADVATILRYYRSKTRLTQEKLGINSGIDQTRIAKWESGTSISGKNSEIIANYFLEFNRSLPPEKRWFCEDDAHNFTNLCKRIESDRQRDNGKNTSMKGVASVTFGAAHSPNKTPPALQVLTKKPTPAEQSL